MKLMTSSNKSILYHDFRNVMKDNVGLMILGMIIFLGMIPVSTVVIHETSIFNVDYTHQQLKFRFYADSMVLFINTASICFGAATGMSLFGFMNDKRKIAFSFSVGLTRTKLFAVRIFAGIIILSTAMMVPMIISFALNDIALGIYDGMMSYFFTICAGLFLQAFVSMMAFEIACCLAGTLSETVMTGVTIMSAPTAILYFFNSLMKLLLWGNIYGESTYSAERVGDSLLSHFSFANPAMFFYKGFDTYYFFSRKMAEAQPVTVDLRIIVGWLMISALTVVVGLILFKRKKAENAEMAGLNKTINNGIPFLWSIAVFATCCELLNDFGSYVSLTVASLCFAITFIILTSTILNIKSGIKNKALYIIASLCLIMVSVCIFSSGFFGYSGRIPDISNLDSVGISYVGTPSYLPVQMAGNSNGRTFYFDAEMTFSNTSDIKTVMELHNALISQGRKKASADYDHFSQTVVPYDIKITYHLKSGKTIERYYNCITLKNLSNMLKLEKSNTTKHGMESVIKGELKQTLWNSDAFAEGEVYFSDIWYHNPKNVILSDQKRKQLLSAIASDVAKQSLEDRYFPESQAMDGIIMFTLKGDSDLSEFSYNMSNTMVYVTKSFKNTLMLLDQWGISNIFEFQGDLEALYLQKFDPYSSMNGLSMPMSMLFMSYKSDSDSDFLIEKDFGTRPQIKDRSQLQEIIPKLRNCYFMSGGGYLAAIKIKGREQYVYKFLPYEDAPEFVKEKL